MFFMLLDRRFHLENIIIFLIILLPVLLISGPFLPDLVITISAIYSLYLIFLKKNIFISKKIESKKIIIFLILFWLYIIISSIFSNFVLLSLKTSFFYIRFILFLILFNYFLTKYENKIIKYFFISSSAGFLFLIFDAYIQYFIGHDLFMNQKPYQRLTATFGDEQIVGSFVSKFMPFYIGLLIMLNKNRYFIFFTILISCLITFLSGERSATFYVFVYSLVIVFFLNFDQKKNFFIFLLIIFSSYFTFLTFDKDLKKRHLLSFETIFDFKENKFTLFSEAHEYHYLSAYNIFLDNKILGSGPKTYRYECRYEKYYISTMSCTTHPHNILLQFASETGILGLLFYVTSLIFLLVNFFKLLLRYIKYRNKEDFFLICLTLCILNYLSFILPSGNFFNNWLSLNLFLPLSFYIFFNKIRR